VFQSVSPESPSVLAIGPATPGRVPVRTLASAQRRAGTGLRIAVVQHEPATSPGSFTELLADAGVEAVVVRTWQDALPDWRALDGVIVLGGSARATDPALADERRWIATLAAAQTPYLGVCLGAQLLAAALGATIFPGRRPAIGISDIFLTEGGQRDHLFASLPARMRVFRWHEDTFGLARGAMPLAGSIDYPYHAFRWGHYAYGLQFHPEATARGVAAWPWTPGYLDQLQTAGADAGAVIAELAEEEPSLRQLAAHILGRWLALCAAAATRSGPPAAHHPAASA
jgi:GMP synthase-like glutamine amidotransferase